MNNVDPFLRAVAVALLLVLTACTAVSREDVQDQVTRTVAQRMSQPVDWPVETLEEQRVQDKVRRMLDDTLTVEEAVAIAMLNNRELRAVLSRAEVARADLVQAGLLDNPVFGISILDGTAGTQIEYSLFMDFLDVFTLSARKHLAAGELERARLEVAQAVLDLAAEVKQNYYALLADRQMLVLYDQVLDATGAAAELARRQYAAGNLSLRAQSLHQSFFAQAALEAARAESSYASDREKINRLLGLWGPMTAWQLPPTLPEPPSGLPAVADLERQAMTTRLDLAARQSQVQVAHMMLGYARQLRWLSLFGLGFTVERDVDGNYTRGPDLVIGLPIFNRSQGRMARLEAELLAVENQYAQMAIDLRAQVREADTRLNAAHDRLTHFREAILPLADRVLDETLKLYNGMLVDVYELLDAKASQISAVRDYIGTWRDFWIAWTDLERAIGAALPVDGQPAR
ncbi:TolC family protein [Desulfosarcina sp.]|uniref:TolC family protein n=1 Tax=Desulfosarcina sp. TaxID=2027861 RepID=UPI003569609C